MVSSIPRSEALDSRTACKGGEPACFGERAVQRVAMIFSRRSGLAFGRARRAGVDGRLTGFFYFSLHILLDAWL